MSIRVLLVDDHPIVLLGLRNLLQSQSDFEVVGEARDGETALEMIRTHRPDIVVVDLMMPGMNGFEVLQQCRSLDARIHVIILSMHVSEAYMREAMKGGAMGYVVKDELPDDLINAILTVTAGRRYLSTSLQEHVLQQYIHKGTEDHADPYFTLTNRERAVLHFAAEGLSNPQIATSLAISPRTVEIHRSNMMRKLGLRHQSDLVRYAVRRGILASA